MSFNDTFDQHSRWRRSFSTELQHLSDWLQSHDLLEAEVAEHVEKLRQRVKDDKVLVAFVAEFSRGKSELINAIFFAEYGRRIMPASAGRTTMCPTELGYDPELPPSLKLLPIETRLAKRSLADWRDHPHEWVTVPLNLADADGLAASMMRVADVCRVTPDQANALGFWQSQDSTEKMVVDSDGLVEVPKWRHALINVAHPILKQGLVILDTPGLNAIGAEPELTVSLLPQAHSIVFILGADTGVTQSDLRIWREHLAPSSKTMAGRVVVLNKIDTLWDELSTQDDIRRQIDRQVASSAATLGMNPDQVLAVSAQKGLVAKINGDPALLSASQLPKFEDVLVQGIVGKRRELLQASVEIGVAELVSQVGRLTQGRGRDFTEQIQELESLRGKNSTVIRHMRLRIEQEQTEFESGGPRIQAVRSVHMKLLRTLFDTLGDAAVRKQVSTLIHRLKEPGLKLGVRKTYGETFDGLRAIVNTASALADEINGMLSASFSLLNAELGFSLQVVNRPDLSKYLAELSDIEQSHVQYLGVGNMFKLAQPDFCERLGRALLGRLRVVYESATNDLELWNRTAAATLDGQLRDRRRNFSRRIEAVSRIQEAAGGLDDRMSELATQQAELSRQYQELCGMTQSMLGLQSLEMASALPNASVH